VPGNFEQARLEQPTFPPGLKPIDFIGFIGILRLRSGHARSRTLLQSPQTGSWKSIIPDLGHEIWDFLAKLVLFSPTG
jgi:hypothetical protein